MCGPSLTETSLCGALLYLSHLVLAILLNFSAPLRHGFEFFICPFPPKYFWFLKDGVPIGGRICYQASAGSRDQNSGQSHGIKTDISSFERVEEFRYLGTNLIDQNSIRWGN